MEITIIHGQSHKGSTYHITEMMKESLVNSDTAVHEYFMPQDTPSFCVGCYQCIQKGEEFCPQAEKVLMILDSMIRSDVVIIDSPAYCCEMTGQLKTLFDHFAFIWMPHRPRKEMFSKIGIVISTTAGAGARNVTKSIARQMFWWGIPKIYKINVTVNAAGWKEVPEKIKQKIIDRTENLSKRIKRKKGLVKPNIKTVVLFNFMRKMQKINTWNMLDKDYWKKKKWLEKSRPWRNDAK